jgi:hypothetical protein
MEQQQQQEVPESLITAPHPPPKSKYTWRVSRPGKLLAFVMFCVVFFSKTREEEAISFAGCLFYATVIVLNYLEDRGPDLNVHGTLMVGVTTYFAFYKIFGTALSSAEVWLTWIQYAFFLWTSLVGILRVHPVSAERDQSTFWSKLHRECHDFSCSTVDENEEQI